MNTLSNTGNLYILLPFSSWIVIGNIILIFSLESSTTYYILHCEFFKVITKILLCWIRL